MPVLAPAIDGDSAPGGGAQNAIPYIESQGLEEWGVSGTQEPAAHSQI